jgi:hypothetical protein
MSLSVMGERLPFARRASHNFSVVTAGVFAKGESAGIGGLQLQRALSELRLEK